MLNRTIQPELVAIDTLPMLEPDLIKLSNGIPVYYLNSDEQEVVRIELVFEAGTWFSQQKLLARFTGKMLLEGSKMFSSTQISEIFDSNGAHIDVSTDQDYSTISLICLNKYLKNTLAALADLILNPVFPAYEFNVMLKRNVQDHQISEKKVSYVAGNNFLSLLLGSNHPYGRITTADSFYELSVELLKDFWKTNFQIQNANFFVSGKVDAQVIDLLNTYFGAFKINQGNDCNVLNPTILLSPEPNTFIPIEGAVQNSIKMGFNSVGLHHADKNGLKVVNTILGGYFGSRLMTNIREDKGFTYGIGSRFVHYKNASFFMLSSEVNSSNSNETIDEIFIEIEKLKNNLVGEEELALVKNYLIGTFLRSFDGIFSQMDQSKNRILNNLPKNYYQESLNVIHSITADEILNLTKKHFEYSNFRTIIVGTK